MSIAKKIMYLLIILSTGYLHIKAELPVQPLKSFKQWSGLLSNYSMLVVLFYTSPVYDKKCDDKEGYKNDKRKLALLLKQFRETAFMPTYQQAGVMFVYADLSRPEIKQIAHGYGVGSSMPSYIFIKDSHPIEDNKTHTVMVLNNVHNQATLRDALYDYLGSYIEKERAVYNENETASRNWIAGGRPVYAPYFIQGGYNGYWGCPSGPMPYYRYW